MVQFTRHAERRVRQRGCRDRFVERVLDHADVMIDIGGGCCLHRVSRTTAHRLTNDRLSHFAVIVNEDENHVVTVAPIANGQRGRRYRRRNR